MSLLDATSRTVTVPLRGKDEEFPKLSYLDKAEILRADLKRRRTAELETLTSIGITGAEALPYLRKIEKEYESATAFVDYINRDGGHDAAMAFIFKKGNPEATEDQIAFGVENLYPDEKFAVVVKSANLIVKAPAAGGEDPLTKGTANPQENAVGETIATA